MTLYRTAIIYESHMPGTHVHFKGARMYIVHKINIPFVIPEHFEMQVFNATPLYVLDICEVCGSYQCPYCPYFSASLQTFSSPFLIVCSLVAIALAYLHRPYSSL
jgi:hypothetical protein